MNKSSDDQKRWTEFREYFDRFVVNDIEKSLKADIEVGTIILTAIGIDCLSGYFGGKPTEKSLFVQFINEFMPKYGPYATDIYECIRNGLAHDYIVKTNASTGRTFGFTRDDGEDHLVATPSNPNKIILNRVAFARDFLEAQRNYLERVENDQVLWDRAMKRLGGRGFLAVLREDGQGSTPSTAAPSSGSTISTQNLSTSISTQYLSTGVVRPSNPPLRTRKPKP